MPIHRTTWVCLAIALGASFAAAQEQGQEQQQQQSDPSQQPSPQQGSMQEGGTQQGSQQGGYTQTNPSGKVDLNKATKEELQTLPGVDENTAQKIIDNRPYSNPKDLVKKGVVSKSEFKHIKKQVTAKKPSSGYQQQTNPGEQNQPSPNP
jgi:DNA uptake protein ComE-like DNA-binding protein